MLRLLQATLSKNALRSVSVCHLLMIFCCGCASTQSGLAGRGNSQTVLYQSDFSGSLSGWSWVREDRSGWIVNAGVLSVRSDPGALAVDNANANMPLRRVPSQAFAVEATIEFAPVSTYEQAGLVLYVDDDNYTKFQYEMVEDGQGLTFTYEDRGEFGEAGFLAIDADRVRLRLEYQEQLVTAYYWRDAESVWSEIGTRVMQPRPDWVGFATGAGSMVDPRWASYSDFAVYALAQ